MKAKDCKTRGLLNIKNKMRILIIDMLSSNETATLLAQKYTIEKVLPCCSATRTRNPQPN